MKNYNRTISWSTDDFIQGAYDAKGESWKDFYDESKFVEALDNMIDKHDAMLGITWDTIRTYLDLYCRNEAMQS
jgi:hypothetical protein